MIKNGSKNSRDFYILIGLVVIIFLLSFRNIVFTSGFIGHTWDWGYPLYPSQIKKSAELMMFYVWNDITDLGISNHLSKSLFLFGLYNYIFHSFGGIVLQRVLLFMIFIFSGSFFYLLAKFLSFNRYAAIVTSIFYAFSPFVYSRIVAGHLIYLVAYGFLPLFLLVMLKYFLNANSNFKKGVIYLSLITVILAMHISFVVLASLIVLLGITLNYLLDREIKGILKKIFPVAVASLFLNAFWITSYIAPFFLGTEIPRGTGFSANFGKISYDIESAMRSDYLKSVSQPIDRIIRGLADSGLHTEFVFPKNDFVSIIALAFSFFIPVMVFLTLVLIKKKDRNFWFFMLLALTGITLSSGVRNPFGYIIYEYIFKQISILYSLFSNPIRFMPLLYVSYAVLIGYFIQAVSVRYQNMDTKKIKLINLSQYINFFALFIILLMIYPFLSGNITKPLGSMWDQPLSLIVTNPKNEEKKIYEFLEKQKNIRVSYLPSFSNSYVGETDLNFEWSTWFSPVPEFMSDANIKEPLSKYIQTLMVYDAAEMPLKNLGKLFGLASSKYIIFPEYKDGIIPYVRFEGVTDIQKDLRETIMRQKDIVKDNALGDLDKISIYRNQNILPLIYGVSSAKVFTGTLEDLRRYFETEHQDNNEAYFFLSQIPEYKRKYFIQSVADMGSELIDTNDYLQFLLTPEKYTDRLFTHAIFNPGSGWLPLANNWSKDINFTTLLNKDMGIYSKESSKLSIEYLIGSNEPDKYVLYGLFYFHPAGGDISIEVDKTDKFIVPTKDSHSCYRYIQLGRLNLKKGEHKIDIFGEVETENVILAISILPKNVDNSIKILLEEMMKDCKFSLVLK